MKPLKCDFQKKHLRSFELTRGQKYEKSQNKLILNCYSSREKNHTLK